MKMQKNLFTLTAVLLMSFNVFAQSLSENQGLIDRALELVAKNPNIEVASIRSDLYEYDEEERWSKYLNTNPNRVQRRMSFKSWLESYKENTAILSFLVSTLSAYANLHENKGVKIEFFYDDFKPNEDKNLFPMGGPIRYTKVRVVTGEIKRPGVFRRLFSVDTPDYEMNSWKSEMRMKDRDKTDLQETSEIKSFLQTLKPSIISCKKILN